jgi:hypothetical protein
MVLGVATMAGASTPLQGQIALRPLTPSEIKDYALTNAQGASGLSTIGLGEPAYLEILVNAAIPPAQITNVTWALSNAPVGSAAALAPSPLGTNVPTYKMAERYNQTGAPYDQVAGRILLRPDIAGQYTVTATVQTVNNGATNLTQTITAGTYMGIQTCELCHSGGRIAQNKVDPWSQTLHATIFTRGINGLLGSHYSKSCIPCHTVGYDANPLAVNGGFDDVAKQLGWTFPAVLTNSNWAAMPAALTNLANIQCENCHGPGSQHAFGLGDTNQISVTFAAGDCAQCHDEPPQHIKAAEWNNSLHARVTRTPSGAGREACARCHTGGGFAGYAATLGTTNTYTTNNADTTYTAITCSTCHEPHDAANPHQLRTPSNVLLADGVTVVTNAGLGTICMNCHRSRNGSVTNSIVAYPLGQQTWAGGSSFGPHDNPASDMVEGVNGWTYGQNIPSSAHRFAITNVCVGCHMQTVASTDPAFLQAGGHSMNMSYGVVAGGVTNTVDKVDACVQCHGPITSFDRPVQDYNGDGVIEGVQTEVQHILDQLSTMLPNSTYVASGNYVADGLVKTSLSVKTNWPAKFLKAAYNWQFVNNDGSQGVHNAPYAVGLLKASIADLTGDANNDGLPDWWQIQYFGSAAAPNAAPNASPAGDGVPNWLKFSLGLDPLVPGITVTNGVVWANGSAAITPGSTNAIQIFTAAEVVFTTEVGTTYQLQSISSLGSGWQNVGEPIAGNGLSMSFLTPTRNDPYQFYRVVHSP